MSFLSLIDLAGKAVTFWIYAAFGVITFFFCRRLIPETKDKALEEIEGFWSNYAHWKRQRRAG